MSEGTEMREAPESGRGEASAKGATDALRDLLGSLLPAIIIVLAINLFIAQPRTVEGDSMEPTLHDSERLIIELISYRFGEPSRGSIIVLNMHERHTGPLVKRVIGLPGDIIEITNGAVLVNGQALEEPYVLDVTPGRLAPSLVPEGHVFVLGDNRPASNDSRYFGMVPYQEIIGRAWVRYWPLSEAGLLY